MLDIGNCKMHSFQFSEVVMAMLHFAIVHMNQKAFLCIATTLDGSCNDVIFMNESKAKAPIDVIPSKEIVSVSSQKSLQTGGFA